MLESYKSFKIKIDHNTKVLEKAHKNGTNLTAAAVDMYTWDSEPGELHFSKLARNLHDIIPCAFLGALAKTDASGEDGIIIQECGAPLGIEVKTSEIDATNVWKGTRGGLCVGKGKNKTQRSAVTSVLKASYACHTKENMESKEMLTYLFIADTSNKFSANTYIDAWEMDGKEVLQYLKLSDNKNRTIKLSSFMKSGQRAETTVPLMGFHKFKEYLENTSPDRDYWLRENGLHDDDLVKKNDNSEKNRLTLS